MKLIRIFVTNLNIALHYIVYEVQIISFRP